MLGRADAELALGSFRQLANGNAGHAINDSIAINDCKLLVADAAVTASQANNFHELI
jgi:hypothetical protein